MNPSPDVYGVSSLLPYLRCDALVRLSVTSPDSPEAEGRYPFLVLDDAEPTTRLLAGRFVTAGGSVLKRVFLLMQKDAYLPAGDASRPLTNPDVDAAWRKAFALYRGEGEGAPPLLLAGQLDSEGDLRPFSSLFYCTVRDVFFHPPCPVCGRPLRLCADEQILAKAGLQPYSTSTYRYLYCGVCCAPGDSPFYVYETDHASPPTLQDRRALIRGFASLDATCADASFPCGDCPEREACYGPRFAACSRIVPFSFYPFHMLVFDAFDLNSRDFLFLVAGASPGEVEERLHPLRDRARIDCLAAVHRDNPSGETLLPMTDERRFLEVLYLKLSFLDDVLHRVPAERPERCLSLDTIWVKLPERSDRLPAWWNFVTGTLDLVRPRPECFSIAVAASCGPLLHAGLVWFSTLLVNRTQGDRDVYRALESRVTGGAVSPSSPWEHSDSGTVFLPENVFWDPEAVRVSSLLYPLWERALDIGLELVRSALSGERIRPGESFFEELARLRSEVRDALFGAAPCMAEEVVRETPVPDDRIVHDALLRIAGRWRDRAQAVKPPLPPQEKDETTETVILSARPEKREFSGIMDTDEFMETIILSPNGARNSIPSPPPGPSACDEAVPETVIIPAGQQRAQDEQTEPPEQTPSSEPQVAPDGPPPNEDLLAETIILAPRKIDPRMKGAKGKNGS
jgi:hypothetical protein